MLRGSALAAEGLNFTIKQRGEWRGADVGSLRLIGISAVAQIRAGSGAAVGASCGHRVAVACEGWGKKKSQLNLINE